MEAGDHAAQAEGADGEQHVLDGRVDTAGGAHRRALDLGRADEELHRRSKDVAGAVGVIGDDVRGATLENNQLPIRADRRLARSAVGAEAEQAGVRERDRLHR